MTMTKRDLALRIEKEKNSWVIDMEKKIARTSASSTSEEEDHWKKPCIFTLPEFVREMKPEVFKPRAVALGPYHHDDPKLKPLESHKERSLLRFLKKAQKPLEDFVKAMKEVEQTLQDSYFGFQEDWKKEDKFMKIMITDCCFMLEVMRLGPGNDKSYAPSDPFFGLHALQRKVPYLRRDMLILENQVPLLALKKLVSVEKGVSYEEADNVVTELLVKFFVPRIHADKVALKEFTNSLHALHALDFYRLSKLFVSSKSQGGLSQKTQKSAISFTVMRSAVELQEAGVRFRLSSSPALTTVSFNLQNGVLTLPHITVDDTTECEILNMVAFEHLHSATSNEVSSYVVFMDALVDSAMDVQLLHGHEVIYNGLGSDKDLARLFNSMTKEVIVDQGGSLGWVQEEVETYCRQRWHRWRANLVHTYFRSPWSVISVVAGAFVILLTVISTVFTILQWKG